MRRLIRLIACSASVLAGLAGPAGAAPADVCMIVDDGHDMLSSQDRTAALLLLARQFELNGMRVVESDCAAPYTLSHVVLGNTITVTLSGPGGRWEGVALGMDDSVSLYGQMVRSIVTGRPVGSMRVVDRTNVTVSQTSPRRVGSDSFGYARIGDGGIFGDRAYGTPSLGFGYRAELDTFALDVSFFNFQANTGSFDSSTTTGSLVKIEGLRFTDAVGNATGYYGGGVSWGWTDFGGHSSSSGGPTSYTYTSGHGGGLAAELTAGYEFARATTLRVFVQADAALPLYKVTWETFSRSATVTNHRYVPSVAVSLGLGWQRGRH